MTNRRQTFYFPEQAAVMLASIRRRSRMDSSSDVIRAALNAYDDLLELMIAGCMIEVVDQDGRRWPFSPYVRFSYPGLSTEPETAEAPEKTPRNFVFSAEAAGRLESIRKKSFLQSNADAMRAALSVFDELLRVAAIGDRFVVTDRAGRQHVYVPFAPFRHEIVRDGHVVEADLGGIRWGRAGKSAGKARQEPEAVG